MNAIAMRPTVMKVIPSPRRAAGTLEFGVCHLLPDCSQGHDSQEPADTGTERIDSGFTEIHEIPFLHEEGASEDGAVHCDQREEDTQLRVQGRGEFLHHHFHYLGDGRHDCDEHDETEEAQVHIRKPGPCEGTGLQYEFIQQVVDRQCDQQHSDNSYSQTGSCLHIL